VDSRMATTSISDASLAYFFTEYPPNLINVLLFSYYVAGHAMRQSIMFFAPESANIAIWNCSHRNGNI
jgi:hypothetical protein